MTEIDQIVGSIPDFDIIQSGSIWDTLSISILCSFILVYIIVRKQIIEIQTGSNNLIVTS